MNVTQNSGEISYIFLCHNTNLTIEGGIFSENQVKNAVFHGISDLKSSVITIKRSIFFDNAGVSFSTNNISMVIFEGSNLKQVNNKFSQAIINLFSKINITSCNISNYWHDYPLYFEQNPEFPKYLSIKESFFINNVALDKGGVLTIVQYDFGEISKSFFINNINHPSNELIYLKCASKSCKITIEKCEFSMKLSEVSFNLIKTDHVFPYLNNNTFFEGQSQSNFPNILAYPIKIIFFQNQPKS